VNNINGSILRKMDVIQKERPDIIAMMQKMAAVPVEAQMKPFIRTGFPNY
jgi:flagellar basal body P-ring protein FlgI